LHSIWKGEIVALVRIKEVEDSRDKTRSFALLRMTIKGIVLAGAQNRNPKGMLNEVNDYVVAVMLNGVKHLLGETR
jgi:hypothetical protein